MKKWSDVLVKRSVNPRLLDPKPSDTDEDRAALSDLRGLVARELNMVSDVRRLKSDLRTWGKSRVLSERLEDILNVLVEEELEEISDDIGWSSTPRRRFVTFVNDYVQELHKRSKLRSDPKFAEVYVGAHSKREEIIVTGIVAGEDVLEELRSILSENDPGVPLSYQVTFSDFENACSVPATMALEMIGPMPGILIRDRRPSLVGNATSP